MFYRRDATRVSLAYRYHNPNWDLVRNQAIYGDDHNVEGIGGNLTIWLESAGEIDTDSVLLVPENSLQPTLERLKASLDHRCLFEVEPWFERRVPTLENIALFLAEKINRPWHSLTVEENENWSVQIFSSGADAILTKRWREGFAQYAVAVKGPIDSESGLIVPRALVRKESPEVMFFRIENPDKTAFEWRRFD